MKKLKLSLQNIEGVEVLTRAQLKNVLGGTSLPEETTTSPDAACDTAKKCGSKWDGNKMVDVNCTSAPATSTLPSSCYCPVESTVSCS